MLSSVFAHCAMEATDDAQRLQVRKSGDTDR